MSITVTEFISLDGVVQAPGGPDEDRDGGFAHGGWSHPFFDPEVMGPAWDDALSGADALLYGRRTWQGMAAAWPGARRRSVRRPDERDPEVRRLLQPRRRRHGVEHDPDPGRRRPSTASASCGDDSANLSIMGSAALVRTLLGEGLVDELRLMIEPVLLGGGKSIFPEDGGLRTLELVSTVTAATGTNVCIYRVAGA